MTFIFSENLHFAIYRVVLYNWNANYNVTNIIFKMYHSIIIKGIERHLKLKIHNIITSFFAQKKVKFNGKKKKNEFDIF